MGTLLATVIGAVVGGSGITGILFYFMRRYLEKKLTANEELNKKRREQRLKRLRVDDELQHCEGRLFFWLHKAIVTGSHNGDLEDAFKQYQEAESAKKELDREIVAENELGE